MPVRPAFLLATLESSQPHAAMQLRPIPTGKALLGLVLAAVLSVPACTSSPAAAPTDEPISLEGTVVSLTFDDGDADNFQVRAVLAENGLRATWYVISGFTGSQGYLTADQLRLLHADGHEIGGHTRNHRNLLELRGDELRREVCQGRLDLLDLGFEPASFAYPYGHYDEQALQAVRDCGYNSARIVTGGPESIPPPEPYALRAFPYIVSNVRLPKMRRYVTQVAAAGGGWVIFVFHHVCDDCDEYSIDIDTLSAFADWLGNQRANGLQVKTVGEVVGGELQPGVVP